MLSHARLVLISVAVCVLSLAVSALLETGDAGLFGVPTLPALALICFAIQWVALIPAYLAQTEHFYDLTGALTYACVVVIALWLGPATPRALLLGALVLIWCSRLGGFLFRRVRRDGKDGRFDAIKPDFGRFCLAWTLQGLWVFLTLLAALVAMGQAHAAHLDLWAATGLLIWCAGFVIEVVADGQKSTFKQQAGNAGRFIDSGLWAWSRHPNYFGEILLWTGVCVIAIPAFSGWQWLGLVSPVFVAILLIKGSGIPLLEQRADEKWGGQPDYERYKALTPVLIPRPPRRA
ncbi:MAG: DUF1295 domain-containing protein [Panacagrimonas sp.]